MRIWILRSGAVLAFLACAMILLAGAERLYPQRPWLKPQAPRLRANLAMGAFMVFMEQAFNLAFLAPALFFFEIRSWGLLHWLRLAPAARLAASFLVLDLAFYAVHRALHEVPWMWRFHRVHHSDRDMDVTTAPRCHPGEFAIELSARLVCACLMGVSFPQASAYCLAAPVFIYFQHCNFSLPGNVELRFKLAFTTPDMHRVHHSTRGEENHSNYGIILSVWDRWLGSFREGPKQSSIEIGLPEYSKREELGLGRLLRMPFEPGD
ncbi:MAG: sterol desaturase family protein [Elusimicrobia bacterium]|nr:sterol desaturase family protein [Elusimicrobiota bacterium]